MIEIKFFNESDNEFSDIAKIYNLVSHDDKQHPDDLKDAWLIRDKNHVREKLLLYENDFLIGFLSYSQGRDENKFNCYFNIFLNSDSNYKDYSKILFQKLLIEISKFQCKRLYTEIWDHPNYDNAKSLLIENKFKESLKSREYTIKLKELDFNQYDFINEKMDKIGIQFYDSKYEMKSFTDHYKKLEELEWTYSKDIPAPDGIKIIREPFEEYMKDVQLFEDKHYAAHIVALDGDKYIGSTDIEVFPKSDSLTAWTCGLGVLREYRRKGIATALKLRALKVLYDNGIHFVKTDNEENNPMYLINENLGFNPEPYCIEYQKDMQ